MYLDNICTYRIVNCENEELFISGKFRGHSPKVVQVLDETSTQIFAGCQTILHDTLCTFFIYMKTW